MAAAKVILNENIDFQETSIITTTPLHSHHPTPSNPAPADPDAPGLFSLSSLGLGLSRPAAAAALPPLTISQHDASLRDIIGPSPSHALLFHEAGKSSFFHAACAYVPLASSPPELFCTSAPIQLGSASTLPVSIISKISFRRQAQDAKASGGIGGGGGDSDGQPLRAEWMKLKSPPGLAMPAGMVPWREGILYAAQGANEKRSPGLAYMPRGKPPEILCNAFSGRDFNSPWGLCRDDGDEDVLWFTDPGAGYDQDFRPAPAFPAMVYRYDGARGEVRPVADGFQRPMGVAVKGGVLYVSDSGAAVPLDDSNKTTEKTATIYAFDIIKREGSVFLTNRRLFAFALRGIPLGLQVDDEGNLYAGCSDGVEIWNKAGSMLGVIQVPGGISNFCFGATKKEMFLCGGRNLWMVRLD